LPCTGFPFFFIQNPILDFFGCGEKAVLLKHSVLLSRHFRFITNLSCDPMDLFGSFQFFWKRKKADF